MQARLAVAAAVLAAVACALPKYDVDPTLDSSTRGGKGGTGGKLGNRGGTSNSGGTGNTGTGGTGDVGAGGAGDARELACGEYCMTYLMNCRDSPANTYDDFGDCLSTCFNSDWPLGEDPGQINSVQCRVIHAHLASGMPDPHCFHSAEFPTGTFCAPPAN